MMNSCEMHLLNDEDLKQNVADEKKEKKKEEVLMRNFFLVSDEF